MDWRVNQDQLRIRALQALHGSGAAVSRTVVDDPEDATRIVVWRSSHYLLYQSVKRLNAILLLAAAKDPGMVNIQRGDVGSGAASRVLVLDLHRPTRSAGASGVFAAPCLHAGLFVGRDHQLLILQWLTLPLAGIQIQYATGFISEVGIAWKDPTTVAPGPNGVLV
jgi:hypothetical protein